MMLIDMRSIQSALHRAGYYVGAIDGDFGKYSRTARDAALAALGLPISSWPEERRQLAIEQWTMMQVGLKPGPVDGFKGPSTLYALEKWQDMQRQTHLPAEHQAEVWPRQKDMAAFYGAPGTNHTMLALPYPMRLAWDTGTEVTRITINRHCAESAGRALNAALAHYGHDRLKELGLDLFGGCFNNRKMRGGSQLSTHAYAAALDINPAANELRWGADRAAMAKPACAPFLGFFEAEGWISLGREKNYDWMHVQAARF